MPRIVETPKVSVATRIDPDWLPFVDQEAEKREITRSAWIELCIRRVLEGSGYEL